ncbi:MAG TPA: ribose 5-phosphate isomerase A [Candidatus Hodarchaeales archaeon]|nr:ribose 5-phosphate isomerase A [Candidatus Hodarchaeales archaeon]
MKWKTEAASRLIWSGEIINKNAKEKVARTIAKRVQKGDIVGVGSGSTSFLALKFIAERIRQEDLEMKAVPTSHELSLACTVLGIPTTSLMDQKPDWCFDGADEVDPANNLIKGRGGAMFKEKILLSASKERYILVDESKLVTSLGEKFPIPVEVFPQAIHYVQDVMVELGANESTLRLARNKDGPVITENGNFILDVRFPRIQPSLEKDIKLIPGVLESGLFIGYKVNVLVSNQLVSDGDSLLGEA